MGKETGHTHKHTTRTTQHTTRKVQHHKRPHEESTPPPHLTTIEGGASTVRAILHVKNAERGRKYGILFIFNLVCEYINLAYVRVPVVYRVDQVEHRIHILVVASQEYVNAYSTRRRTTSHTRVVVRCEEDLRSSPSRHTQRHQEMFLWNQAWRWPWVQG